MVEIKLYRNIAILQLKNISPKLFDMGVTKTELFTDKNNEIAAIAKVLGHPARITILELLCEIKGCICNDLVDETGLSQPTISQHLTVLKNAGLIRGQVTGNSRCYCIDPVRWSEMKAVVNDFFDKKGVVEMDCC